MFHNSDYQNSGQGRRHGKEPICCWYKCKLLRSTSHHLDTICVSLSAVDARERFYHIAACPTVVAVRLEVRAGPVAWRQLAVGTNAST